MAQKVVTTTVCDVGDDEHEASTTTRVGLDGVWVEVDLCDKHQELLQPVEETFHRGRRVTGGATAPARRSSSPAPSKSANRAARAAIRAWALENGFELGGRGRIPTHIVEAFDKAKA